MSEIIKQIEPNPILTAAVEIRFSTDDFSDENKVLPFFYPIFSDSLKQFIDRKTPKINFEGQVSYLIDYVFTDGTYAVSVGKNVILFEIIKDYPLWNNFFDFIKKYLKKIKESGLTVKKIERIGVRYISLLPKEKNLQEATNFQTTLNFKGLDQKSEIFRTELSDNNGIGIALQITQGLAPVLAGVPLNEGLTIDIDTSSTVIKTNSFDDSLFQAIDDLHSMEKQLFTEILSANYKKKLNITYK